MRIEPEMGGVAVVLLGSFNPSIFTPAWFVRRRLLPDRMEEEATLHIAHKEITVFDADWLHLEVRSDRLAAETVRDPHVRVRDLLVRIFQEHLQHTPLRALGINRSVHFRVHDLGVRDRIGRRLAPTSAWGAWGQCLEPGGKHGGMTSLTMTQVDPEGRSKGGRRNVTVEPSRRVGNGRDGIFVTVNDHFVAPDGRGDSSAAVVELLAATFDESRRRSEAIIDQVMSLGD